MANTTLRPGLTLWRCITAQPIWLVGFRPFFVLACLSGILLPLLWVLVLRGALALPGGAAFSSIQWHAHEMLFGFGWAVLGGFLLTSTKNWVHIRGYHGVPLMFLAAAWFFERLGMWFAGIWPNCLFQLSNNLFLGSIVAMVAATLLRHHKEDTYRDNYFFLLILPAFLIAKHLLLGGATFAAGVSVTIGLFRMAFLVMLERTLTQFMRNAFQTEILRNPVLDRAIKLFGLVLVVESLLPPAISVALATSLAVLLMARFVYWKPLIGMRRIDIGIMYVGYLAIVVQLLLVAAQQIMPLPLVGSVTVHVFTVGVMGLVIPAMIIRIAKGHTGRKVVFDRTDRVTLWVMFIAFGLRIVAPQVDPGRYLQWIDGATVAWLSCFAIIAWRYFPFLFQKRMDGREH